MSESARSYDRFIVRACVEGDRLAWRQLHRHYYPVAAAFLRRMGVPDRELEDACQEVFVRVFRALPRFRGDSELQTWLYRLCMTEARRVRRRKKTAEALASLVKGQLLKPSVGLEMSEASARDKLQHALSALPERERTVLVLFELDGLNGKEIATIVGRPEATVWRLLHYGRQKFRAALGCGPEDARG